MSNSKLNRVWRLFRKHNIQCKEWLVGGFSTNDRPESSIRKDIDSLVDLIRIEPMNGDYLVDMANSYHDLYKFNIAERLLIRAEGFPIVHEDFRLMSLVRLYERQKLFESAQVMHAEYMKHHHDEWCDYRRQGELFELSGDIENASKNYRISTLKKAELDTYLRWMVLLDNNNLRYPLSGVCKEMDRRCDNLDNLPNFERKKSIIYNSFFSLEMFTKNI